MRQPNEYVRMGIRAYNRAYGLAAPIEGHYTVVDPVEASEVAAEYDKLPIHPPTQAARACYRILAKEIERQYIWATEVMGITFVPTLSDPYADSEAMIMDVLLNKRMGVYASESDHPFFTHEQQVMFRGIHDLYGHAAEGFQFGPRGEHNAWIHHSMMFSPLAQRALTTETRGQNSWVNFGPHSHLPVRERPFAIQKAAILPLGMCEWQWSVGVEA